MLGTRQISGEPEPNVRLGFARDVDRDELRGWIDDEDSAALLGAMVPRPTVVGDVWFVPPGTPHAIGAGVFILEVQEPTDFSIVLETAGFPIDRADASLRLGWDRALDAIDRRALDEDGIAALRGTFDRGLPGAAAPFFWTRHLVIGDGVSLDVPACFAVGIVLAGRGVVHGPGGDLDVSRGDAFAVPASAVREVEIQASETLEIIVCGSAGPAAPVF